MKCENTPGSYLCVEGCEPGYIWSLKQGECRDIDECSLHKHNCTHGHRCENMPGSFRCIRERNCGTGYQVDPITQTCIGKTRFLFLLLIEFLFLKILMNVNKILMNAGK
jgi:hypothetical protein